MMKLSEVHRFLNSQNKHSLLRIIFLKENAKRNTGWQHTQPSSDSMRIT